MDKKGNYVTPQTLESDVIALHQFPFDGDDYRPSDMIKKISSKISADSGMYNEGKCIDKVGTDDGYIPEPIQNTTRAVETTIKNEKEGTDVSISKVGEGVIDDENEWNLETDESEDTIDPLEDESPGFHPGTTWPPGTARPDGNNPAITSYPGYTASPTDENSSSGVYPGSTMSPGSEVTGPDSIATVYPGSITGTSISYPGSTIGTSTAYPSSTTIIERYVPEGPGFMTIGPGS